MKPVNLIELVTAFKIMTIDYDCRCFVDARDGQTCCFRKKLISAFGEYFGHELEDDDIEISPDEREEMDEAKEFADRYDPEFVFAVPTKHELGDFGIMQDFAEAQPDERKADALLRALRGDRPYKHFRDAVDLGDLLDDWHDYQTNAILERLRLWCRKNGLDCEPKMAFIEGFLIRTATAEDLPTIKLVYDGARRQMELNGNPTQWSGGYPWPDLLKEDVEKERLFVMTIKERICGVFAFMLGVDPTYVEIEDGAWLNDEPYGAIHRIASNGERQGVFKACLDFCLEQTDNVRIDTHADNALMQAVLLKNGFKKCGVIYVRDGVSDHNRRTAFQYAKWSGTV